MNSVGNSMEWVVSLACVQNSMEGPGVKIMLEISWEGNKKGFLNRGCAQWRILARVAFY